MKTNFAKLDDHAKKVWSRDVWHQAREKMFITKFMGKGQNSMIQVIPELTKSERGLEAVVTLVPDIEEDGVTGDNTLDGQESEMKAVQDKVQIDQLRNAVKNTGRLADQATVVNFREQAKDQLSQWLADRSDQLAFLTLAGMGYDLKNDGSARGGNLAGLSFASDVAGPSSDRYLVVQGNGLSDSADNSALEATDTLGYQHIVRLQAYAKTKYVRGVRGKGGSEVYHLFVHPLAMADLKLDPDFLANARHAGVRGGSNSLFSGGDSFIVDGLMIHEYRHVPTTLGTATKWGATNTVDGCRALLCGAQALAMIDLDSGIWDERDHFDYGNNFGIAYGKMFGMKKPKYLFSKGSTDRNTVKQDYGVIAIDMALNLQGIAA